MKTRHLMMVSLVLAVMASGSCRPTADGAGADSNPSVAELRRSYDAGVLFVDVRSDEEWSAGHVRGAVHVPVTDVAAKAASVLPDKNRPLVLYCASGGRARSAAGALRAAGYSNVTAMSGGYGDLAAAGFPVEK